MKKKRKRKFIRIEKRKTPRGKYFRLFVRGKMIFGKNEHPFKQYLKVPHYHVGEKIKIVRRPKQLRDVWIKRKGKYERFSKVVKEVFRGTISRIRGRGKKRRGNRQANKRD
ncbi:hypothetical protein DRP05_15625 [Archaeoglobales archaeon]|nr:MAG: hypothetical protein DRO97_09865 [Archaeoglobales archaeon]RLI74855.1 MAG: hypothetical protein DRP05_15625 [Archaeoglobales archaeon]